MAAEDGVQGGVVPNEDELLDQGVSERINDAAVPMAGDQELIMVSLLVAYPCGTNGRKVTIS